MERITIIGMGPVGTSIGLALKGARLSNTELVGTGGDKQLISTISKMGAIDKAINSLRSALEGAQMVILDVPLSEIRELLEAAGPILEDGCVVTDIGSSKVKVMDWADQYLPRGVSYVGGHPLIKTSLDSHTDADPKIFNGVNYCVLPSKKADQASVKTIVGLVETLGAKPLFLDAHEHDSYAVAMTHLPMVLSSALVTATSGSESWREMYKLAASEFAEFSKYAGNDPEDNELACLVNSDAIVHWIDEVIKDLYAYRNLIKDSSEELLDVFITAWEARAKWEAGAIDTGAGPELPSARQSMASAFFGERIVKRYQQATEGNKGIDSWRYNRKNETTS